MIEKGWIILQKSADFFEKRPNDVILSMPRKGGGGTGNCKCVLGSTWSPFMTYVWHRMLVSFTGIEYQHVARLIENDISINTSFALDKILRLLEIYICIMQTIR